MRAILLALAATMVVHVAPVHAQSKTGTSVGQFMLIEPSARIVAMGNAGVSMYEELQGVYYNPAALAQLSHTGVAISHAEWLADIAYNHLALTIPMGRWGNSFGSLTALNSGEIAVRTVEQPLGTGQQFTVSDIAIGVGYGLQVTDRVAAGIQVNYVQETIWNTSASTVTMNVGTLYRLSPDGLAIGASLSNFGTGARFSGRDLRIQYDNDPNRFGDNNTLPGERSTNSYPVPQEFRVGLRMPYKVGADGRLLVVADAFHPSDNTEGLSFGGEFTMRKLLSLRAGYQDLFQQDSEVGLTLGAGVQTRLDDYHYQIDYAWADQGRLAGTHRVTLGVTF